ncbi:MAG: hypothetical protein M3P27_09115 [Acidobacteriota bacterium]|nr:hypothetical protein [Acidobacteriota bacterium]
MKSLFSRFSFLTIAVLAAATADAAPQSFAAQSSVAQPIGEVFASDATVRGSVQLTSGGAKVMSGANVTAGDAAARLALARGGEVRVCAQTSVAVSASSNGRELMFAMGSGAIEADYKLAGSADTDIIVTPDFRILLAGPGTFHFALRSRPNGDTCVQARTSNGASLVLTEMMGDATYQVKPHERVLFRKGRLSEPQANPMGDCGCPPPAAPAPVLRAEAPKPAPASVPVLIATEAVAPQTKPPEAPAPELKTDLTRVEVDSPFVFRAEDLRKEDQRLNKGDVNKGDVNKDDVPPAEHPLRASLATLPKLPAVAALPPAPPTPKRKGAFARLKSFFGALFK